MDRTLAVVGFLCALVLVLTQHQYLSVLLFAAVFVSRRRQTEEMANGAGATMTTLLAPRNEMKVC